MEFPKEFPDNWRNSDRNYRRHFGRIYMMNTVFTGEISKETLERISKKTDWISAPQATTGWRIFFYETIGGIPEVIDEWNSKKCRKKSC